VTTFFVSDTHFYHKRILEFCPNRPWKTVEEMNAGLIKIWNDRVGKNDVVYHVGDFGLNCTAAEVTTILEQLKGSIHLIKGNHDHHNRVKDTPFCSIEIQREIKIEKQHIVLNHFPLFCWNNDKHGYWHIHGHCHGGLVKWENPLNPRGKYVDVGIDAVLGIGPHPMDVIRDYMKDRENRREGSF
jgi:calcineurin-like phosphoesterase family protein